MSSYYQMSLKSLPVLFDWKFYVLCFPNEFDTMYGVSTFTVFILF